MCTACSAGILYDLIPFAGSYFSLAMDSTHESHACVSLVSYISVQNFRALLDKNGQRWVPIIDPPIHIKQGYAAYDTGITSGVFIQDITGRPYAGQVSSQP